MATSANTRPFQHTYFAHEIYSMSDFDQLIHAAVDTTQCHCYQQFTRLYHNQKLLQEIHRPDVE